jgi:hypothetical protein
VKVLCGVRVGGGKVYSKDVSQRRLALPLDPDQEDRSLWWYSCPRHGVLVVAADDVVDGEVRGRSAIHTTRRLPRTTGKTFERWLLSE